MSSDSSEFTVKELMQKAPVIPVLVVESVDVAVPLADALCRGGLTVLEVTLRSDVALSVIAEISKRVPAAIVGAGTVNSESQMKAVAEAGARFAVSPGFTPALAQASREYQLPWLPGVCTPGEILLASQHGHHALKFFPAAQAGGSAFLKALSGPFPDVVFCPTGGIGAATAKDYLSLDNVLCVGGSWVAPSEVVRAGQWEHIETLAREASQLLSV